MFHFTKTALLTVASFLAGHVTFFMAAPSTPVLIDRNDTNLVLTFQGLLQHAQNPQGPYTNITGAISPYSANTSEAPAGFWRTQKRPFAAAARRIATGERHSLAIGSDGTLWAWGENFWGQLSKDTYGIEPIPTRVQTNELWEAVAAGGGHSAAIRKDGTLWTWGRNSSGQLGVGNQLGIDNQSHTNVPQPVLTAVKWKAIAAGTEHTVGLSESGTLLVWGFFYGRPPSSGSYNSQRIPLSILPEFRWKEIAAGDYHTAAVRDDGSLWV